MTSTIRLSLLAVLLVIIGFAWGFAAHRQKFFPFSQLRRLAIASGVVEDVQSKKNRSDIRQVRSRSAATKDALIALGYVDGTYDPDYERGGVLEIDHDRVYPGVRFYCSRNTREARLIDVTGRSLFTWNHRTRNSWESVYLLENGDILAISKFRALMRIGKGSELAWTVREKFHHDLDVFDDTIYALTYEATSRPTFHDESMILEDFVVRYRLDGRFIDRFSLYELVANSPYRFLLPSVNDLEFKNDEGNAMELDILHGNHVQVMDGSLSRLGPAFRRGNVLVNLRNLNASIIFDPATMTIEWIWGPANLTFPHHPVPLANGNMLVFDNGTSQSQVLELDPLTFRIQWRFTEEGFFTETRGAALRLPNGNTLITESDTGYVFEVTTEGDKVWTFAAPDVDGEGVRRSIFRMLAYAPDATPFLEQVTSGRDLADAAGSQGSGVKG